MSPSTSEQIGTSRLLRLLDVSRQLSAPNDLNVLLTLIIEAGREVLGADRGSVFLYDAPAGELFAQVATGEREIRFSVDTGIAGECARGCNTINVHDCYADSRFNQAIDRATGYHTRCLIAVPLIDLDDQLVGVMQLLNPSKNHFDEVDERVAEALASQAAVAIQRARLIEDRIERLKLEADLDLARQIQMGVLPTRLPACEGYDLAHFSRPADQTGGDIYDVVELDQGDDRTKPGTSPLLMFLADATGHGIGPALSVTQARAMLRIALRYSTSLDDLLNHINAQLTADLASNRFITAFLGILDPLEHTVIYHAPGQGPLLHFQAADQKCNWHVATTVPLGIMEDPPIDSVEPIDLAPGDILALITDGFYEYQNQNDEQFGQQRVGSVITQCHREPTETIMQRLVDEVLRFAGRAAQQDDLTALIVKRLK